MTTAAPAATSTATSGATQAATTGGTTATQQTAATQTPQGDATAAAGSTSAGTAAATHQTTDAAAAAAAAAQQQSKAPATHALTLPKDNAALDQSDVDAVITHAKAKGWTNEQAQAALDEMSSSLVAQSARFETELKAHPEIGGANFEAAQQHAQRALEHFMPKASPEGIALRTALNKSGYGNHPGFVQLLARIGKAMGEDGAVAMRSTDTPQPTDMAELLYGKPNGRTA